MAKVREIFYNIKLDTFQAPFDDKMKNNRKPIFVFYSVILGSVRCIFRAREFYQFFLKLNHFKLNVYEPKRRARK